MPQFNQMANSKPINKIIRLPTQIAGHGSESGTNDRPFLKRQDGKILKPVQAPPKGHREKDFYSTVWKSKDADDLKIQKHIPEFFGIENLELKNGIICTGDYLVLEDITVGFKFPNMMDVKLGEKTYGPDASAEKMVQEDSKYLGTKQPFGFSVLGLIVHAVNSNTGNPVLKLDKNFGKDLKQSNVYNVPNLFLDTKNLDVPELTQIYIEKMEEIRIVFDAQRKYKIFASSLLLVYDADAVRKFAEKKMDKTRLADSVKVKLIDFAHVFDANGERDNNFMRGLENLIGLFRECLIRQNKLNQK